MAKQMYEKFTLFFFCALGIFCYVKCWATWKLWETATQPPRNYPPQNCCITMNAFRTMRLLCHNSNVQILCRLLPSVTYGLPLFDAWNKSHVLCIHMDNPDWYSGLQVRNVNIFAVQIGKSLQNEDISVVGGGRRRIKIIIRRRKWGKKIRGNQGL